MGHFGTLSYTFYRDVELEGMHLNHETERTLTKIK